MNTKFQRLKNELSKQIGRFESLVINLNTSLQSLDDKSSQQDSQAKRLETRLSEKNSEQDARAQNLEINIKIEVENYRRQVAKNRKKIDW